MKSQNKRPKGQNPAKTLKRLMGIILKNYTPHCIVVLLCIFGSAFVSVKGTLFMQTLIDDYILPLTSQSNPDFRPLGMAIMKLALFFIAGALMTYTYNTYSYNGGYNGTYNLQSCRKSRFLLYETTKIHR